jgi:outer membrane protein, adhesin transport system
MKKRLIYFMICLLGSGITAQAQYTYTLKQCLEEGLANNYSLRITRNEEQISKNNATLGNAGYLPTVDLILAGWLRCCRLIWPRISYCFPFI